ncbi:alpha/beta fold hydrolase [Mycolicibacterium palauense]|uniref:alpha/beta fold hydrolase n=1 Tax=Mycolicibacterium palauense TaxID=2034511 RepID=UPI000BFEC711|nr:alpha/beta hydrolase [Mycolicibacterium palauense]
MDSTIGFLPAGRPLEVDGATVMTYTLGGPGARGDVVFCHGTPWSARVWADVAARLGAGYRVFLWDMPGYGAAPKDPAVPVDLAAQMSRFARLLDHWGLQRPHVVAHDIGGAVALGAHLLHHRDYAGMYLWDPVVLEPWGSAFFRLVAEHGAVFAALPAGLHAALVREYIGGAARHRLGPDWVDALTGPWTDGGDQVGGQAAFYRQIAALRSEHTRPIAERLDRVRCPVALGWGRADPWIPAEQALRLQRALPGAAPLTMLDDVGHLAPVEAPSLVAAAIDDWLAAAPVRN